MYSLFSELFRKFGGVFLEVFEIIYGDIWRPFWFVWDVFSMAFGGRPIYYLIHKTYKAIFKSIKYYLKIATNRQIKIATISLFDK